MADRITYPSKSTGDYHFAAEVTEVKTVVNSHADDLEAQEISNEAVSLNVRADKKRFPTTKVTQSGTLTFTGVSAGAINGYGEVKVVVCDGSNITLSGAFTNYSTIQTTASQTIVITFIWNSSLAEYMVSVDPAASGTAPSIITFSDTFTGTTIDTNKWVVTDPADDITISQNDELIFTTTGNSLISWGDNYLESNSQAPIPNISTFCASLDFKSISGGVEKDRGFLLQSAAGNTLIIVRTKETGPVETALYFRDSAGTVVQSLSDNPQDVDVTGKSVRIRHESNTLYLEYYNAGSWTLIDSVATGGLLDTDCEVLIRCGDNALDSAGTTVFDNMYVTNSAYSNQYPS